MGYPLFRHDLVRNTAWFRPAIFRSSPIAALQNRGFMAQIPMENQAS
jgi:hypothetical protein